MFEQTAESELDRLMKAVSWGDQRAFSALYDLTCGKVHGLVSYILKDDALAEEVTLDTYLQVWQRAGDYQSERASPLAWLMMIARSRAIDRLRAQRSYPLFCDGQSHDDDLIDPLGPPDETVISDERCHDVRRCFTQLDSVQRQVLAVAFFRGLSHTEIALHCGMPLGTVKTHIRQAMARLKGLLAEHSDVNHRDGS